MYNEQEHSSHIFKTEEEVKAWLEKHHIRRYEIEKNPAHSFFPFSVKTQNVNIYQEEVLYLPVEFASINGNFDIEGCSLKSLRGMPKIVKGNVSVSNNSLTSLEFCAQQIAEVFDASRNQLENLDFFPIFPEEDEMGQKFANINLHSNKIKELKLPQERYRNINLTLNCVSDLSQAPLQVLQEFNLNFNPLRPDAILNLRTTEMSGPGNGFIILPNDPNILGIEYLGDMGHNNSCYIKFSELDKIKEKILLEKSLANKQSEKSVLKI